MWNVGSGLCTRLVHCVSYNEMTILVRGDKDCQLECDVFCQVPGLGWAKCLILGRVKAGMGLACISGKGSYVVWLFCLKGN